MNDFAGSLPSSPRVALWRRLRAIGAAGVSNGAWVLPHTVPHVAFFEQLHETVRKQGGSGLVLTVSVSSPDTDATIVGRFRADRGREYNEVAERGTAFLAEIDKETRAGKFTFAELEENEQDLEKLAHWLAKIQARDFFPDERWPQSIELLERCRKVLEGFSRAVYEAEEVQAPPDSADTGEDDAGPTAPGAAEPSGGPAAALLTGKGPGSGPEDGARVVGPRRAQSSASRICHLPPANSASRPPRHL
jgi:hypothetical protein